MTSSLGIHRMMREPREAKKPSPDSHTMEKTLSESRIAISAYARASSS